MKGLFLGLLALLKWAKFGKVFVSAGSIILSMWTYSTIYGWPYAAGFVALIFVHEMGHYLAARSKNLEVGLPTFIPFFGAFIQLKDIPKTAEVEAYVAIAGPYVGSLAAFACYFYGRSIDSGLFMALAQAGFMINLFNLLPISPLDGGRITAIISPRIWFLGVPALFALWMYMPSPMLAVIGIMAVPQLIKAWHFDPNTEENRSYYDVSPSTRIEYALLYLGLACVLALMVREVG